MADIIATNENNNRRSFLRTAGIAGAGILAAGVAHAAGPTSYGKIPFPHYLDLPGLKAGKDVQVLNYALTLEDLEADLYVQALQRVTTGGVNKIGTQIPGLGLKMMEPDVAYYAKFAPVEARHRDFLRGSLNSLIHGIAVRSRKYDFKIEGMSREEVLALVLDAEATGLAAYLGAIPKLKTKLFITPAAAIQGTEARHTTILTLVQNELFNGANPKPVAPLASNNHGADMPIDPDAVLAKVAPWIVG